MESLEIPEITLIGKLGSPYVRRTAVLLELLGLSFSLEPVAALTEQDLLRKYNPIGRVPALKMGERVLIDSVAIALTLLDRYDPAGQLLPRSGWERADALQALALINGTTERVVTAYYEETRRPEEKIWPQWIETAQAQARGGLDALENLSLDPFARLDYVQICAVTSLAFFEAAAPGLLDVEAHPKLVALLRARESESVFASGN